MRSWARMPETLKSILATDAAFAAFSILALVATIVVAIGLFLEYERHELFGASKKQIGALMVAGGVVLEAFFGLGTFLSAMVRESRSELQIATLTERASQLAKDAETARGQIASANERAANAAQETEKEKSERVKLEYLTTDRFAHGRHLEMDPNLWSTLAASKSASIVLIQNIYDSEAQQLACELASLLPKEWNVQRVDQSGGHIPNNFIDNGVAILCWDCGGRADSKIVKQAQLLKQFLIDWPSVVAAKVIGYLGHQVVSRRTALWF